MIIGVFSDAHGNEPGFYKCYEFLALHADIIFYLGDAVGYFPLSNKIIETLRTKNVNCLKGNHDAMVVGELSYESNREEIYQVEKSKNEITAQNLDFLKGLKSEKEILVDNRNLLFIHGSPVNALNGYVYPDTKMDLFENLPYHAIFMGHTHRPFIKRIGDKNIINVGSAGLPRDIGNRLTVVLYDTIKNEPLMKAFEMNIGQVIKKYGSCLHPSVIDVLNRNNKTIHNE